MTPSAGMDQEDRTTFKALFGASWPLDDKERQRLQANVDATLNVLARLIRDQLTTRPLSRTALKQRHDDFKAALELAQRAGCSPRESYLDYLIKESTFSYIA
jgi:type VI protein secretion system component VasK